MDSELVKEFVIAAHFNLPKVEQMLNEHPELLMESYEWQPGDLENGLQAGSHVGNRAIAEFFLSKGLPMMVYTAAMLGRYDEVKAFLDADSSLANGRGVHSISLLFHAAMSGEVEIVKLLKTRGCTGDYDHALHGAINYGHSDMVAWLLENGVRNVNAPDYQGKTPLKRALETENSAIADLLRQHNALEEISSVS